MITLPPTVRNAAGIGLRFPHAQEIVASRPAVGFLEIHAENHMGGGRAASILRQARRDFALSLHGVGLSLGSAQGIDARHLRRLAELVEKIEPVLVSEHLSWSAEGGSYLNDLLPLPYTAEALRIAAANVSVAQDWLRRPILVENPSAYLRFKDSPMPEEEFLSALARAAGCGILLDVNNLHVSCANLGGDAMAYLRALPDEAVMEIHLAGHALNDADGAVVLIDDHGSPVAEPVWRLYDEAIRLFPQAATLVEWDSNLPPLDGLLAEAAKADARRAAILSTETPHARAA